jgi:hypothetical protein
VAVCVTLPPAWRNAVRRWECALGGYVANDQRAGVLQGDTAARGSIHRGEGVDGIRLVENDIAGRIVNAQQIGSDNARGGLAQAGLLEANRAAGAGRRHAVDAREQGSVGRHHVE